MKEKRKNTAYQGNTRGCFDPIMEDRSGQVLAVAVLFFILCWIAVGLRIYCRGWITRSLGTDDKMMIALMVLPYERLHNKPKVHIL